jgi:hypothetical protein
MNICQRLDLNQGLFGSLTPQRNVLTTALRWRLVKKTRGERYMFFGKAVDANTW